MKVASTHVAVSSLLRKRFPKFVGELGTALEAARVTLHELERTRDVWARDYCLIQRHDGKFVTYTYQPDYLRGYRHLNTDQNQIRPIPAGASMVDSGLTLDGGNVVLDDVTAIVGDKIFTENPHLSHRAVQDRLRRAFELENLIIIPNEPGDIWGHADGMVGWAGRGRVLMNDYRRIDPDLHRRLKRVLVNGGLDVAEVPYAPHLRRRAIPSACGCYINLLALPELLVIPIYGIATDDSAVARIQSEFADRQVVTIDASSIAREGGSLHCVTSDYLEGHRS